MKLILKSDVQGLGSLGDEVVVKDGYGRNFLIPQGQAVPITKQNKKEVEHHKALLAKKRALAIEEAQAMSKKLIDSSIEFKVKAGESGKLFGSITLKQILEALHDAGIDLSKKTVQIAGPIKTLGTHSISAKLHTEVTCNFEIKISADEIVKDEKPVVEEATEEDSEEAATEGSEESAE